MLAHCSGGVGGIDSKLGVSASPRVVGPGEPVPKGGGVYRVGKPYVVGGRTYVPREDPHYHAEGLASWYGEDFHGRLTANGEVFDMASITAAHPTLPLPSYVRITNLRNGHSIVARVNDRGPYHNDRLIDVSVRTAKLLGFYNRGVTRVRVDYVGRAPLEGSDDQMLVATLREHGPAPAPSKVMLASTAPLLPPSSGVVRSHRQVALLRPARAAVGHADGALSDDQEASVRVAARTTRQPALSELTAAQRVEQTLGSGSLMASIADPIGTPSAGVLGRTSPVSSFAAPAPAAGAALMSGRGLY